MTKVADRKNLIAVKQALADKYDSLARSAKSVDKRRECLHNAERYRRQVARLGSP